MGVQEISNYSMDALLHRKTSSSLSQRESSKSRTQTIRRTRTLFTASALKLLESEFLSNRYPDILCRETIAANIGVAEARVQVWFQNRRARDNKRHKSTDGERPRKRCRFDSSHGNTESDTIAETAETTVSTSSGESKSLTGTEPNGHILNQTHSTLQTIHHQYYNVINSYRFGVTLRPSASSFLGCHKLQIQPTKLSETRQTRQGHTEAEIFLNGMFRFSATHGPKENISGEIAMKPYIMTVPAKRVSDCSVSEFQRGESRSSDCMKLCSDFNAVTSDAIKDKWSGVVCDSTSDVVL